MAGKCKVCAAQAEMIEFNGMSFCAGCFAIELESLEHQAAPGRGQH